MIIWQLPQIVLGVVLLWFLKIWIVRHYETSRVYICARIKWGVSLGSIIILGKVHDNTCTIRHEYGHSRQSKMLGWLYLPVVGVFSGLHNVCHRIDWAKGDYYRYWCERWADKLENVKR